MKDHRTFIEAANRAVDAWREQGEPRISLAVRPGSYTPPPRPVPVPMPMPTPRPIPLPAPAPTSSLQSCKVSSDCTLHFQVQACAGGEPVAVSVHAHPAAVRKAYPVQNIACGMGGPQYDDLRASNENRYTAACEHSRCVAHDAGPQPTMRDRLGAPSL